MWRLRNRRSDLFNSSDKKQPGHERRLDRGRDHNVRRNGEGPHFKCTFKS